MDRQIKTPTDWLTRKQKKQPISVITGYDAAFARLIEQSPIDAILTGDSLGMVVQGKDSTVPVTLEEMIYHAKMVRRGSPGRYLIADMPMGSYQSDVSQGVANGIQLFKETGAQAVKLEGSSPGTIEVIERLVQAGVPVMGHAGLTPQSYLTLGGYRVLGKTEKEAMEILESALLIEKAGAFSVVLELVEESVSKMITDRLQIPTIGIGAGPHTDGQVQVLHDMIGMDVQFSPRHAKQYNSMGEQLIQIFEQYHREVQEGSFRPDG